jgi:hypothetical protein
LAYRYKFSEWMYLTKKNIFSLSTNETLKKITFLAK